MPPSSRLHHALMRRAFGEDGEHPAAPATLVAHDAERINIRYLDGTADTAVVCEPDRLRSVLERPDLCRLQGQPLLLVNSHYGVMGVATGPAEPPPRLEVLVVSRLEHGCVVELPNNAPQPSWQVLALQR